MPKCWDNMVQCKLCKEWLQMAARDLRLPRRASGSVLSADRQTLDVFVIVKVLFGIPQQLIIVEIRK